MNNCLGFLVLLIVCNQPHPKTVYSSLKENSINERNQTVNTINDSALIIAFRNLRVDIYQKKPENFIEFPNKLAEELSYVIMFTNYKHEKNINSIALFKKQYNQIFEKEFIHLLLKVKSEKLIREKKFKIEKKVDKNTSIYFETSLYEKKISITYRYNGIKIIEGSEYVNDEWSKTFIFEMLNNKFLLKEILLAG